MTTATVAAVTRSGTTTTTGLWTTARLVLRRSRLFWTIWVLALVSLMPATLSKYHDLIPAGSDPEQLMTTLGSNPTLKAILGPPFDLSTPGGFTVWRVGAFTGWAAAMAAALAVVRATRADEEEGRTELVLSSAVGRHAVLAGALVVTGGVTLLLGLLIAASLSGLGAGGPGAVAAGLGVTAQAWMFAGIAAVCAQVFESARQARAWSLGIVLGGLYLVRAIIDGSGTRALAPLRWLVPLEWSALVRPYAHERWWVFALPVGMTVSLIGVAFTLQSRRDYGAGLRATALGPAGAASWLGDACGLAIRLHRTSIIGWSVGVLVGAFGMGSIGTQMDTMLKQNPRVAEMMQKMGGAGELTTAFYIAMVGIMATVIALAAVQFLGRLRAEETAGHAEAMLATGTSRTSFALSHLLVAVVVPVVLTVLTGVVTPLAQAAQSGDWSRLGDYTKAVLVLLPGLVFFVGFGMLLLGWVPRLYGLVWALVGWTMFCTWLAALLNLPTWLVQLQPWGHLPKLPAEPMSWTPVLVETAIAWAMLVTGLIGYRRRDVPVA